MKNYFFKTTHPFSVLNALLDDSFPAPTAPVNIRENETGYYLQLMAPGFTREDIKVTVQQQQLTVSASVKTDESGDNQPFARQEFTPKSFSRTFTLPKGVDVSKIAVKYENGLVLLFVPKPEEAPKPAVLEIAVQ